MRHFKHWLLLEMAWNSGKFQLLVVEQFWCHQFGIIASEHHSYLWHLWQVCGIWHHIKGLLSNQNIIFLEMNFQNYTHQEGQPLHRTLIN